LGDEIPELELMYTEASLFFCLENSSNYAQKTNFKLLIILDDITKKISNYVWQ
jgi:hypothetical protein